MNERDIFDIKKGMEYIRGYVFRDQYKCPLDESECWMSNCLTQTGYIDVGDGCWRPNVLVTSLRWWWPIQDVGDRFNTLRKSPT